jgi:hypothetical protein
LAAALTSVLPFHPFYGNCEAKLSKNFKFLQKTAAGYPAFARLRKFSERKEKLRTAKSSVVLNGKTRMVSLAAALGVDFVTRRHLPSNLLVSCAASCLFWSPHGNDKLI